jgi:hypothetical protein
MRPLLVQTNSAVCPDEAIIGLPGQSPDVGAGSGNLESRRFQDAEMCDSASVGLYQSGSKEQTKNRRPIGLGEGVLMGGSAALAVFDHPAAM